MTKRILHRALRQPGRQPKQPPADAAERIRALAASGHSRVGIAVGLNCNVEVFTRWLEENPALAEAFERGRESERFELHNVLYRAATEGKNIVAAMFLLKARHGYVEGDQRDTGNKVSITFNLPGALSPVEFLKAIEIEHGTANQNQPVPAKSIGGT